MTPKERAKKIYTQFYCTALVYCRSKLDCQNMAKDSAFIAVENIIEKHFDDWDSFSEYWELVKNEIEML